MVARIDEAHARAASRTLQLLLEGDAHGHVDRDEHDKAWRYYHGEQLSPELRAFYLERDWVPYTVNLLAKDINSVLGAEEKRRVDMQVIADDEAHTDVAEAQNVLLNEAFRLHDIHHHCSEAYAAEVTAGRGWVYVGPATDPFGPPLDVESIPDAQMLWDRRSTRLDARDCRYVARKRFLDRDAARALFPEHAGLIGDAFARSAALHGVPSIFTEVAGGWLTGVDDGSFATQLYRERAHTTIAVFDVFYRAYEKARLLRHPDGRVERYDREDPRHVEALFAADVEAREETVAVMRRAWFLGPYLVSDEISPLPHQEFPYVRFEGYRDHKGKHYGLARPMIPSQDAYNRATIQQHVLTEQVTIIMDDDALTDTGQTDADVAIEANRGDGLIKKRVGRTIEIIRHHDQIRELSGLKAEARDEMRAVSGIALAFTGEQETQKSGVAIQSLAQQSDGTLAELNAKFQFAKKRVGILVLAHVNAEIGTRPRQVHIKSSAGKIRKTVRLNEPGGDGAVNNALHVARTQVVLADAETSEGHRQQNALMVRDALVSAPPEMAAMLWIAYLELSNIPNRHDLIEHFKRQAGMVDGEEERAAAEQQQMAIQQAEAELAKAEREAAIDLEVAKAEEARANAAAKMAEAERRGEELLLKAQEMEGRTAELAGAGTAANDATRQRKRALLAQARQGVAARAAAGAAAA